MSDCNHDLAEQETACADGMCPLCLRTEIERLRTSNAELLALLREIAEIYANSAVKIGSAVPRIARTIIEKAEGHE